MTTKRVNFKQLKKSSLLGANLSQSVRVVLIRDSLMVDVSKSLRITRQMTAKAKDPTISATSKDNNGCTTEVKTVQKAMRLAARNDSSTVPAVQISANKHNVTNESKSVRINDNADNQLVRSNEYKEQEIVWSKMKGFPLWPAKIQSFPRETNMVNLKFYGDQTIAKVFKTTLVPFNEGAAKFKPGPRELLNKAVKESLLEMAQRRSSKKGAAYN